MRTRITLDDALHEELKKRATATGTTVSRIVEHAVRLFVATPAASKHQDRFELVTFGRRGRFSQQNIDKTSRLIEHDDADPAAKGHQSVAVSHLLASG